MHLHVCIQQFWTQLYIACIVKPAAQYLEPSPAKSSMDPTRKGTLPEPHAKEHQKRQGTQRPGGRVPLDQARQGHFTGISV